MIVTEDKMNSILDDIDQTYIKGFDVETEGTRYEHRIFSLIISTPTDSYYFNFNSKPDHTGNIPCVTLNKRRTLSLVSTTFTKGIWAAHNAKFDAQKIYLEGFGSPRQLHCTLASERLIRNDMLDYSLESVAPNYGMKKDNTVDDYISEHKLYTRVMIPGKKKIHFEKHFDLVPFEIIRKYGEQDAKIARVIGESQRAALGL
jgi:hypothetical protein